LATAPDPTLAPQRTPTPTPLNKLPAPPRTLWGTLTENETRQLRQLPFGELLPIAPPASARLPFNDLLARSRYELLRQWPAKVGGQWSTTGQWPATDQWPAAGQWAMTHLGAFHHPASAPSLPGPAFLLGPGLQRLISAVPSFVLEQEPQPAPPIAGPSAPAMTGPSAPRGAVTPFAPPIVAPTVPRSSRKPSSAKPTLLFYHQDPAVFSLIAQVLREFDHLAQVRNVQTERDGKHVAEAEPFTSQSLSTDDIVARNEELQAHAKRVEKSMENTRVGVEIKKTKAEMTINQDRNRILQLIKRNAVVVIAAATGSGKTTQLPQIILEDAIDSGHGAECNIFVTQPRKVAAISVARRVRKERFDGAIGSVGHHVQFDAQPPKPGGSIMYCTTGILLNRIQRRPHEVFDNVSHIIVDEVHERDVLIDRLLAMLKWQLFARKRKSLKFPKIILSSATLDIDLFTKYFSQPIKQQGLQSCPFLDIPGRMFPVEFRYLGEILSDLQQYPQGQRFFMEQDRQTIKFLQLEQERRDPSGHLVPLQPTTDEDNALVPASLIALTVAHIMKTTTEGAVLVFLPGLDSIKKVQTILELNSPIIGIDFTDTSRFRTLILHSDMNDQQDEAFETMPAGCRKIVLSTNIAETSVTIPDTVYGASYKEHKGCDW
jgi:late competence protein required for DNA uptake (superfamily II DNA/RNA helicase)